MLKRLKDAYVHLRGVISRGGLEKHPARLNYRQLTADGHAIYGPYSCDNVTLHLPIAHHGPLVFKERGYSTSSPDQMESMATESH